MTGKNHNTSIDDIAAAWVACCDRGPLSPGQQTRLDAWLKADPRHMGAWARANAVYAQFDRARALAPDYDPHQFDAPGADVPADRTRRRVLWMGGVAAAAGLAGVAFLRAPRQHFSTRLGEVLRVPLQDGSAITLNSVSEVVVQFDHMQRLVRLLRGEALFDVAKEAARPFKVETGHSSVVAVGTSFTIQRVAARAVEVMVREGSVDFSAADMSRRHPIRLTADTMVVVDPVHAIRVESLRPLEVDRRLAWRNGMISFDGDSLAQAAAEFARYSSMRIVIDDPTVARRKVVGLYSATDPVGFARAVALGMDLHVERRGNSVHLAELPRKP